MTWAYPGSCVIIVWTLERYAILHEVMLCSIRVLFILPFPNNPSTFNLSHPTRTNSCLFESSSNLTRATPCLYNIYPVQLYHSFSVYKLVNWWRKGKVFGSSPSSRSICRLSPLFSVCFFCFPWHCIATCLHCPRLLVIRRDYIKIPTRKPIGLLQQWWFSVSINRMCLILK